MEQAPTSKKFISQTVALGERLELCADKLGSKKALGDAAGISQAQLFRYIRGESEIPAAKALNVAKVAKVDPTWLLSGEGKPEGIYIPRRPEFRPELLETIVHLLTEANIEHDFRLTAQQRARFTSLAYEAMRHEEILTAKPVQLKRGDIVKMLHYLGRESFDEILALHAHAYRHLILGEPLPAHVAAEDWYEQFTAAVRQAHINWHNSPSGLAYYRRVGQQVANRPAERIQKFLADVHQRLGKRKLSLLDIGCGNGRELAYMAQIDPLLELHGMDISSTALREAAQFTTNKTLPAGTFVEGDFCFMPFTDGQFDIVYSRLSLYTLPYFPGKKVGLNLALAEIQRILKPGGVFEIRTLGGPQGLEILPCLQRLTPEGLAKALQEAGFEVIHKQENPPPAGMEDNKYEYNSTVSAIKPTHSKQ